MQATFWYMVCLKKWCSYFILIVLFTTYKGWIKVMATVQYFLHSFIHRDTTFIFLQYRPPPYLSPCVKCLEGVVHHQRVHLCCWSIFTAIKHGYFHLLCCPGSLAVVLSLWRRDRNRMHSYRVSTVEFPESPIASGARGPWHQQWCDSLHFH